MDIKTITYHRQKNLGGLETEDITLTAELGEDDNYFDDIEKLKSIAADALDIKPTDSEVEIEINSDIPW